MWHPWGVTASEIDFRIQGASPVRWEWFSYGREQTPDNRRDIEHVRAGNGTTVCSDAHGAPRRFTPWTRHPAVELVGP